MNRWVASKFNLNRGNEMNRNKQSGFVAIGFLIFSLVMVGLAGLIGNHPPRHDESQKVDVCKMNGTCTTDKKADSESCDTIANSNGNVVCQEDK